MHILGEPSDRQRVPGTTRDALIHPLNIREKKYVLIDTAGVRKKVPC
jgi:predicted GTPase